MTEAQTQPSVTDYVDCPDKLDFARPVRNSYLLPMPRKPIELPPVVARALVRNMLLFFKEIDAIKRDEIAARQLHALKQHYSGKLRLFDVKEMFLQMRDNLD